MPAGASETKSIVAIARSRVPGSTRKGERGERRRVSGVIRRCGRSPIKHLDWPRMGLGNAWSRALVYFGIVEEEEYWDDEAYEAEQDLERTYSDRPNVRRLHSRRREPEFDDWSDPGPQGARTAVLRPPTGRRANLEAVASAAVKVHLILPRSFNDAQSIADKFKDLVPVIINLQGADTELSKRLIDFSSGLTYALDGSMQRVADKVFLLTPRNVEVSAEERARLIDRGFFNQA